MARTTHAERGIHTLVRTQRIRRPLEQVFAFFSDAANLEALTPAFLHFKILTPLPIAMSAGALIEYQLRLGGFPVHWRTRITAWEPGVRFVDIQEKGPYALWRHTHTFTAVNEGGADETVMRDEVDYRLPFGPLGALAHAVLVRRLLERIFDYREEVTHRLLAA